MKFQVVSAIEKNLKKIHGLTFKMSYPRSGGLRASVYEENNNRSMSLKVSRNRDVTIICALETKKQKAKQDGFSLQELEVFCRDNMVNGEKYESKSSKDS